MAGGDPPDDTAVPARTALGDQTTPQDTAPTEYMPIRCPACQAIVGTGGGNCPHCGTFVPEQARPSMRHEMPRQVPIPTGPPPDTVTIPIRPIVVGGALAVAVIVVLLALTGPDAALNAPPPEPPAPSAKAEEPIDPELATEPIPGTVNAQVESAWDEAATRAEAWQAKPLLFDLRIAPVKSGQVLLEQGGDITFRYSRASGGGYASGSPLGKETLTITVTKQGVSQHESAGAPGRVSATEPNCPFPEVMRQATATGAGDAELSVRYAFSERYAKPVWTVDSKDGKFSRVFDGATCAVVVR